MSNIIKVCLLVAVMICIAKAQGLGTGQQCLCQRVRKGINSRNDIKDIQIYRATVFCNKTEIVVTLNSGLRYCLDPNMGRIRKLVAQMMEKQNLAGSGGSPSS